MSSPVLHPGQRVSITAGPYSGHTGTVHSIQSGTPVIALDTPPPQLVEWSRGLIFTAPEELTLLS